MFSWALAIYFPSSSFSLILLSCFLEFFDKVYDCSLEVWVLGSSRQFSLANISIRNGLSFGEDIGLICHIWTFFVSSESNMDKSRLGQNIGCVGRLGFEVGNGLGRMEIKWTEGTGLVYRMCFPAHV